MASLRSELAALRREIEDVAGLSAMALSPTPDRSLPGFANFTSDYLTVQLTDGRIERMRPESRFHKWLVPKLDSYHLKRNQHDCVLAPRDSAKTRWSTFAYPLYVALHGIERFTVIISDTDDQACVFLRSIRTELMDNNAIRKDYPNASGRGPTWRDDFIVLKNGSAIKALGIDGHIRGRGEGAYRPTLIILDDPQNRDHIVSPVKRERSWEKVVREIIPAGSPITNYLALGTALHRECVVCKLQRTAGWHTTLFKSIEVWPKRLDLWREWENILHDWNDEGREAKARAYYDAHPEMNE